jgi:tetratricopeptide (TPR) repeat protein
MVSVDAVVTVGGAGGRDSSPGSGPRRIAHFGILRELGTGGMGTVYLAHDERMDREVALKVMARHRGLSEKAGKRFEQEAWIAGRLDHPALVKVYERGTWEDLSYFSMEYVDGGSLADVLENLRRTGRDDARGLEFGTSRYVHWAIGKVIEAARGLDFAHRQGVVHRDVKPMNLLLARDHGSVKVADFGLAIDARVARMTTAGTVMGTISFMAPEQIRGEQDKIDARTDVYALGVTLFELLTLELPYTGQTQQLYMSQVLTVEARRASKLNTRVSRDLEIVLRKALEKQRRDRYQSAAALADDLDNVLHLRPIRAQPSGAAKRALKWIRRQPVHAALIATLVVSVPTLAVVGARKIGERNAAREARVTRLLDEARWLEERKRYDAVLERVAAVLEQDPGNTMALRQRAMARFLLAAVEDDPAAKLRLQEEGLADASEVIRHRPDTSWPHAMKAYMLAVLERPEEAAAEQALAARLRPAEPTDEDVYQEARLADVAGDLPRAVELYSELIRRSPDAVRAIAARALAHEALDDPVHAFIDYSVAIGLDPTYDLALLDIAGLSADRGQLDDAQAYLDRAVAIGGDSAASHEVRSALLIARGKEAAADGNVDEARRLFVQAAEAARSALERSGKLVWAEQNQAVALHERGKLEDPPDTALIAQAVEHYTRIIDRFRVVPASGQDRRVYLAALHSTCDAEIALGRLQEALATCSRAAESDGENAVAFYNLAGVHAMLGHEEEALAALERDRELGDTEWKVLEADPWFAGLQRDPRFGAILAEMKRASQ